MVAPFDRTVPYEIASLSFCHVILFQVYFLLYILYIYLK